MKILPIFSYFLKQRFDRKDVNNVEEFNTAVGFVFLKSGKKIIGRFNRKMTRAQQKTWKRLAENLQQNGTVVVGLEVQFC